MLALIACLFLLGCISSNGKKDLKEAQFMSFDDEMDSESYTAACIYLNKRIFNKEELCRDAKDVVFSHFWLRRNDNLSDLKSQTLYACENEIDKQVRHQCREKIRQFYLKDTIYPMVLGECEYLGNQNLRDMCHYESIIWQKTKYVDEGLIRDMILEKGCNNLINDSVDVRKNPELALKPGRECELKILKKQWQKVDEVQKCGLIKDSTTKDLCYLELRECDKVLISSIHNECLLETAGATMSWTNGQLTFLRPGTLEVTKDGILSILANSKSDIASVSVSDNGKQCKSQLRQISQEQSMRNNIQVVVDCDKNSYTNSYILKFSFKYKDGKNESVRFTLSS